MLWILALALLATTIYFAIRLEQRSNWNNWNDRKFTDEQLWVQSGCNQPFVAGLVPTEGDKRLALQLLWHREFTGQDSSGNCYAIPADGR